MKTSIAALVVALVGLSLFTSLLITGHIGQVTYDVNIGMTAMVSFGIFVSHRLREFDLKNLRLVLSEIQMVKADIEKTKAEIIEMYGGIDKLRREPMILDEAKMEELGIKGGILALTASVMSYTTGCIKRERERLAQIFIIGKTPEALAAALVDSSKDDLVFKWNGPEVALETPPRSLAQRQAEVSTKKMNEKKTE